jgi:hypothetical protein
MDEKERMQREAIALQLMQKDMALIKALNAENIGSDEERISAIANRCIEAGYERGVRYPKYQDHAWITVANGPDFRVMLDDDKAS